MVEQGHGTIFSLNPCSLYLAPVFDGKEKTLELNEILQSASNYGFPMLISCYLLVRMESRMNELTEALNKLCVALDHK